MARRPLLLGFLFLLGTASAAHYLVKTGPALNAPLGLDRFDEPWVRERVLTTSRALLEPRQELKVSLDQHMDEGTLRRMQALFGIVAANHWAHKEIPVQRWRYSVDTRAPAAVVFGREGAPLIQMEVSSAGVPQSLKIKSRNILQPRKLSVEGARRESLDLMRILGVDTTRLVLTATESGDSEGTSVHKFTWKETVRGLPGLMYQYEVTLRSGYITSLLRAVQFPGEPARDVWEVAVFPFGGVVIWFFLGLLAVVLFFQDLRQDQVDFFQARQVAVFSAALALAWFLKDPSQGWLASVVVGIVAAVFSVLFFGILWIVAESILRRFTPDKLRNMDCLLMGHLRVRELARDVLCAWAAGGILLAVPSLLLLAGGRWRALEVSLLPPSLRLENLSFPGGLAVDALLRPLPTVMLIGLVFLGILYPILRARFPKWLAALLFVLFFALATTPLLGTVMRPWFFSLGTTVITGAVLFLLMERTGFLAAGVLLYVPLTLRYVSVLLDAKPPGVPLQGFLALGFLLTALAGTFVVALVGRRREEIQEYEPPYLQRMRERERFERELEIAKGIQERFLPKALPAIPGFQVATICVPAMEVGGDTYDILPLPGGKWLLLIGDVSGKGVRAAFYMTLTKGILHAVGGMEPEYRSILKHLNRVFKDLSDEGVFLTLCALVLDPEERTVRLVSAGHTPPVLLRGGEAVDLEPRGLILGVMNDDVFLRSLRDVEMPLEGGDTIVLYTDGVTEAMNRKGEEFGSTRLQKAVEGASSRSPEGILESVVRAVKSFEGGAPQADDLTLLVLRADEAGRDGAPS